MSPRGSMSPQSNKFNNTQNDWSLFVLWFHYIEYALKAVELKELLPMQKSVFLSFFLVDTMFGTTTRVIHLTFSVG